MRVISRKIVYIFELIFDIIYKKERTMNNFKLTDDRRAKYKEIVDKMNLTELIGQVMCLGNPAKKSYEEFRAFCKKRKPGGFYVAGVEGEKIKEYTKIANEECPVPVIVSADIEHGPGEGLPNQAFIPNAMGLGACDDSELIEDACEKIAKICRNNGIHWTFSPVVDLNVNPDNPESNTRSISDNPDRVIKLASAQMKGFQKSGHMVVTAKHFPGQGTDDRNTHFVTALNPYSRRKWMKTYGKVYKEMIKQGVPSIMIGHIALPSFEKEFDDFFGAQSASLSKALMTDLLKKKLGFDGCIVSDAMCMIGLASRYPTEELIVRFFNAGGDMYLFPLECEFDYLEKAVNDGVVSIDRLKDAAIRVLYLKDRARIFENQEQIEEETKGEIDVEESANKIAEKSIKVLKNMNGTIPFDIKKGKKVLFLNMLENFYHDKAKGDEFKALREEFIKEGFEVKEIFVPTYEQVKQERDKHDLILLNARFSSADYHGGSLRVAWDNIMVLWHAHVLQHPNVIMTSFGDPYKIREFPYMKEYINAFSDCDATQRAVAKVILGKIKAQGKNPVSLKPYFEIEK